MLSYSTDALNVKSLFYNKSFIVYVEGQDDINFWDNLFSNVSHLPYQIEESPGGITGLRDYMEKIVNEDAKIIIACDSDYFTIDSIEKPYKHERIIRTYGYSIENSMYCPHNINQLIRRYGRVRKDYTPIVEEWYENFVKESEILLIYDLANHLFSKGIQILGDKCIRFLNNDKSPNISQAKIQKFIVEISKNFEEEQIEQSRVLISNSNKELRFLIKGHFLTNGVLNLIKETIRKETRSNVSINIDSLYALTVTCVGRCKNNCSDVDYLKKQIAKSLETI